MSISRSGIWKGVSPFRPSMVWVCVSEMAKGEMGLPHALLFGFIPKEDLCLPSQIEIRGGVWKALHAEGGILCACLRRLRLGEEFERLYMQVWLGSNSHQQEGWGWDICLQTRWGLHACILEGAFGYLTVRRCSTRGMGSWPHPPTQVGICELWQ
jgi:hypothetical protein